MGFYWSYMLLLSAHSYVLLLRANPRQLHECNKTEIQIQSATREASFHPTSVVHTEAVGNEPGNETRLSTM